MSSLLFFCFTKEKLSDIYFAVADALVVRVDVLVVVDIVIVIDDLILRVHWRDQTGVPHVPTRPQPHLPLICLPRPTTPAYKQAAYTKHNSFEKCKLDLYTKYLINLFCIKLFQIADASLIREA